MASSPEVYVTNHRLLVQLLDRVRTDQSESDFTYFFATLLASEAVAKTIVLGMTSAIDDDTESNRYRLEHKLVRAGGIGDWADVLQDALTGAASQYLNAEAQRERSELTRHCGAGHWQYDAVLALKRALVALSIESERVSARPNMMVWFRLFAVLRNKTRGHGATRSANSGAAALQIHKSIDAICTHLSLFKRQWVYLYRNLSGKYRVTKITDDSRSFDHLKSETFHSYSNGVYVHYRSHRFVPLLASDSDLSDFFFPNGGFRDNKFELLSYVTDNRRSAASAPFLKPPNLHESETRGYGELISKGNVFTNAPECTEDYVDRPELEAELFELLMDDRRPVVTMQGSGGVGKTSATLRVIDRISKEDRYELIVWFSARDIDLLSTGPKTVRPGILTPKDVSDQYGRLVLSAEDLGNSKFDRESYFQTQLGSTNVGRCLFVFDNFETVQNPLEMFTWIDHSIRLPNKILITTRLRRFKGDYPLEVLGMNDQQARTLIGQTAARLNAAHLLTPNIINDVLITSAGHPYVIKILLGELTNKKRFVSSRDVIAGSEEILTALFERTFSALSPCGQRAFLTLAAWNSAVPRIALEAVLIGSTGERTEVEVSIESLLQYSLAEERITDDGQDDGQEFLSLPLAANEFGRAKLRISPFKPGIESDVQILHMFGANSTTRVNLSLRHGLRNFIRNVSRRIDEGELFTKYEPILNMVCRTYNHGWLQLAQWRLEQGTDTDLDAAVSNLQAFLQRDQNGPDSADAWRLLADVYHRRGNLWGELHAFVERARFESVPFYDLSNTANLLNRRYRELESDDGRFQLTETLLDTMESRSHEATPDDFSRMAWLAIRLSQEERAKTLTESGLQMDPENIHCQRISSRLDM